MDFASIRPFVSRVLLAEHGTAEHLLPALRRSFPGTHVGHLLFTGDNAEDQTRELRQALGDDTRWVAVLQAGANISMHRSFDLPDEGPPQSAVHIHSDGRWARWTTVLAPGGRNCCRVDGRGHVFIDQDFKDTACSESVVVDMRGVSNRSREWTRYELKLALERIRDMETPDRALAVAECNFALGRYDEAAFWYGRCLNDLGEPGDAWTASYHHALCFKATSSRWRDIEAAMSVAFELDPYRAEPLFHIADHYRDTGDFKRAYDLAALGLEIEAPVIPTCFEFSVYQHELPLVYIDCAVRLGKDLDCVEVANHLLRRPGVPDATREKAAGFRSLSVKNIWPVYPLRIRRNNRIVVVAPFRNAGDFLVPCVESLAGQDYENCRFLLIDDASNDGALERLGSLDPRFVVERNDKHRGVLHNQIEAVRKHADPMDIVVYVDGDDRLIDSTALRYINDFFNSTRCWIMYGQYRDSNGRYGFCEPPIARSSDDALDVVKEMRFPMHVRAHRAGLLGQLLRIDPGLNRLRGEHGEFLDSIADMALMRMLIQLAGLNNIRYNDRVLYEYNVRNPESHYSDFELKRLQNHQSVLLGTKARLSPVDSFITAMDSSGSKPGRNKKTRMLFIALDGMNPDLIRKWVSEGLLPNLNRLLNGGWTREIETPEGLGDDVFWICLATGALPDELGYYFRIHWNPQRYVCKLFNPANNLPRQPFWSTLSESDVEVAVIDFPETRSAGPVNGLEVAEWMTHARVSTPRFYPTNLEDDWVSRFGLDPLNGCTETLSDRSKEQFVALRDELLQSVDTKTSAAMHYLGRGGWDFFAVAYSQAHDVGHQFWHLHDPAHPDHQADWLERNGDPLQQTYQRIDDAVGRLTSGAGKGARVVLVTGLAMRATASCNAVLDEMLWRVEKPGNAYPADATQPDRRKQRRFFAIPNNNLSGAVRINLRGRESAGLVTAFEYTETLDAVESGLGGMVNADTGQPVVSRFIRAREAFDGPHVDALPDLIVLWNREAPIKRISIPRYGNIEIQPRGVVETRSGDHVCEAEMTTSFESPFPDGQRVPVEDIAAWLQGAIQDKSMH